MKIKTVAAQASKLIREELKNKFPNTKFSVKSSNYAGGNSIIVSFEDIISRKEVEKITNRFEHGSFDGMTDMYEMDNVIEGLPQVDYVFVERTVPVSFLMEIVEVFKTYWQESLEYEVINSDRLVINEEYEKCMRFHKFVDEIIEGVRNKYSGQLL